MGHLFVAFYGNESNISSTSFECFIITISDHRGEYTNSDSSYSSRWLSPNLVRRDPRQDC